MRLFLLLLLFSSPLLAGTCSYGKVGDSIMISNLPLPYGKKGACFGEPPPPSTPSGKTPKSNLIPADFPRVDASAQQQRDGTRRKILGVELETERNALEQAKTTGKTADVALHEKNVRMLEKEISNIK